ncbi:helix-turn-helix domain-containing protein [Bacterioplanoides sp. SCSIO 12839]|uniref:helix-turn-helix domain-containing protein n=1 Tax=Bacterioplanoides sp. SCSIO 12839 TaxID=2829569 RepID=UPI002105EC4D|nr:helix-turn-helix domain-containing protein [Bacterioplanoides sp. SCSIO 12839]UTW47329.1 helix-turn-helix domain-containing protein [Bacterioplanoides sp. SCSIO 12839]
MVRDKQALTTGEVAKYCGVNFRTVIRWIERGHLEAYKLPGRGDNRIPIESFVAFLKGNNMPVPDDLVLGGKVLLLLAGNNDKSIEISAAVRRAGWDVKVTSDPIQFGFMIAQQQPGAIAVSADKDRQSVEKVLKDVEGRDILCLCFDKPVNKEAANSHSWLYYQWPNDQQELINYLTSDVAA